MAGDGLHVVEAGSGGSGAGICHATAKVGERDKVASLALSPLRRHPPSSNLPVTLGWLIEKSFRLAGLAFRAWSLRSGRFNDSRPCAALLVIALSSVVLLRIPGPRRSSVVMIWVALGFMAIAADRDYWLNLPLGEQASVTKQICFGIEILARLAISSYPLILLTRVIEWNYGYLNLSREREPSGGLTAGACMLIALPTVLNLDADSTSANLERCYCEFGRLAHNC